MSEIRATTISDAAGTGPITLTGQSAAKAWVNFNGTGTIAARDSLNVSGLIDYATGVYGVSLTNSFSAANYATGVSCDNQPGVTSFATVVTDDRAVGGISLVVSQFASNIFFDCENVDCLFHGDLA